MAAATTRARPRKLVVAALVRDGEGRVLVTQRRADQPMPGKWELPGGKIEPGESPVAALARELREELGVGGHVGAIYDVVFYPYDEFDLVMLVYACELDPAAPPRPLEVAQIAFVAPGELLSYDLLPADLPLARKLASG
jgi:8-oxo-dGTP diphosphatase